MADDFRLTIELAEEAHVPLFGRFLGEHEIEKELHERLGDGVVVTRDGPQVFLYASTLDQAQAAEQAASEALAGEEVDGQVSPIQRWHAVEERWEDASVPLPGTTEQIEAERARRETQEVEDAKAAGYAEWEVRIDLPSHRDAVELSERLEDEGIAPVVRRWKYILIGAATEEDARSLGERLQAELPAGAEVKAEPSGAVGWELTSQNPFAMFGSFGPGP